MRRLCDICSFVLLLAVLAIGQAASQTSQTTLPPLLTAVGNGQVQVAPDIAQVQLGVETEAKTAADAREQSAAKVGRVIQAVKELGIPDTQIHTSTFDIEPRRFGTPDQQGVRPVVGYIVTNMVTVRTEKFDLVAKIIDNSVAAGANRVDNVSFTLKNDASARQQALKMAVADARTNAETMASELDVKLISVYTIQQGGAGVSPPPMLYRAMEAAPAPTPILPGEVTVSASVTLSYIIR